MSLVLIVPLWNWNRCYLVCNILKASSNRTFMELKLLRGCLKGAISLVLIVPLWNWNQGNNNKHRAQKIVLIVPLWNWNGRLVSQEQMIRRSNRTFMELKLTIRIYRFMNSYVLIVPLWNWNDTRHWSWCINLYVLIVPLWNWN